MPLDLVERSMVVLLQAGHDADPPPNVPNNHVGDNRSWDILVEQGLVEILPGTNQYVTNAWGVQQLNDILELQDC